MDYELALQRLKSLPESLQFLVLDYIEFLTNKYSDINQTNYPEPEKEALTDEIRSLLEERLEKYNKNPENVKTWDEIEQRLLKKHNYEI